MAKRKKPAADPLGEALEQAVIADPDDLAAHMAYADWLSEQSDDRLRARGEFIQVQLALEGNIKSAAAKPLRQREQGLLEKHRDDWLGPLAWMFPTSEEPRQFVRFARGWIDGIRINQLNVRQARSLAKARELRLLRSLVILGCEMEFLHVEHSTQRGEIAPDDTSVFPALSALAANARNLDNVQVFGLGDCEGDRLFCTYPDPDHVPDILAAMPKLRELHLNVRDLNQYHLLDPPVVLGLHTLRLERARLRNDGARELGRRTWPNLRVLQIWNGQVGNAGAKALGKNQSLRELELLDVSFNYLTEIGITALKSLGVPVVAEYQMRPQDDFDNEYIDDGWGGIYDDDIDEFDEIVE